MSRKQGSGLDQPQAPLHRRAKPLVAAVESPAERGGHETGRLVALGSDQRRHQRVDRMAVQLDVVVQQDRHGAFQPGHHVVERAEAEVGTVDDLDLGKMLFEPGDRVVVGSIVDHRHAAGMLRRLRSLDHRRQALLQQPPAIVVEHQDVDSRRAIQALLPCSIPHRRTLAPISVGNALRGVPLPSWRSLQSPFSHHLAVLR